MTVFNLKKDENAKITFINLAGASQKRLFSLGVIQGAKITVLGFSLFKSAVLVECGSVRLAIRKEYAEKIEVERL